MHENTPAMMQDAVLDQNALENLRPITTVEGDNLLDKAIELFFETAPEEVATLKQAFVEHDAAKLAKIAHNLKSSCANLGATELAKKAISLEKIARQGALQGTEELIAAIAAELPLVLSALEKELSTNADDDSFFTSI